jgi:hypothetical protein
MYIRLSYSQVKCVTLKHSQLKHQPLQTSPDYILELLAIISPPRIAKSYKKYFSKQQKPPIFDLPSHAPRPNLHRRRHNNLTMPSRSNDVSSVKSLLSTASTVSMENESYYTTKRLSFIKRLSSRLSPMSSLSDFTISYGYEHHGSIAA